MSATSTILPPKVASTNTLTRQKVRAGRPSSRAESSRDSSGSALDHTPNDFNSPIFEEEMTPDNFTINRPDPATIQNTLHHDEVDILKHHGFSFPLMCSPPRQIDNTATPRSVTGSGNTSKQTSGTTTPDHSKQIFTREKLKRTMSNIFKKPSTSVLVTEGLEQLPPRDTPFDTTTQDDIPLRSRPSVTSMLEPRSSSPPVPYMAVPNTTVEAKSPAGRIQFDTAIGIEDSARTNPSQGRRKSRSLTGILFKDILHIHTPKISFAPQNRSKPRPESRHRASSVDTVMSIQAPGQPGLQPTVSAMQQQFFAMSAPAGVGLKARRMSQSLPDDFLVPVTELYENYSDQSKLFGKRGKILGKGATAHVKLMTGKGHSSDFYAVKEFRSKAKNENSQEYEKKVKSEFTIAKSLCHPNIVKTYSLCTHNGRWNHVMEFCDQGDLFGLVGKHYLSSHDHLKDRLCLFKQLVQGINYLHHHGIAHRDIKLENLLMTRHGQLKITDFGVSEVFSGLHPGMRSAEGVRGKDMDEIRLCAPGICGSPPYIAPEVIAKEDSYDPRGADVWAAAIVMVAMTANGTLWPEARPGSSPVYDSLVNGWRNWKSKHTDSSAINERDYPHVSFFDKCINPPALRRILLGMLNPDPEKRSSMHDVATNRWLKNVECCQLDTVKSPEGHVENQRRDGVCGTSPRRVCHHNHLPPIVNHGHKLVRLPGSTDM